MRKSRVTAESFIKKVQKIHGDRYDYSKVVYTYQYDKVEIICKIHGSFRQVPIYHLQGHGCIPCGNVTRGLSHRGTTESFIQKAREIHGNQYDYSKVSYIVAKKEVTLICKLHGEFIQTPDSHLSGKGCPKCAGIAIAFKNRKSKDFYGKKLEKLYGDIYKLKNILYTSNKTFFNVECKLHGLWKVSNGNLFSNKRICPTCAEKKSKLNNRNKNFKLFVKKVKDKYGTKYDLSLVHYITARKKVSVMCTVDNHGSWRITPDNLLRGYECPKCNTHKGVAEINKYLAKNVYYTVEKTFPTCRDKLPLRYDFYIPSLHLLIEYDGPQHFKPVKLFGGANSFENTQMRDAIKTKWAKDNGYRLLRIKYTDFNRIEEILNKELY
jgi:hypothetical protein